jgi:tripartite-type tricarboxylate transporter receptor subunit TctC
MILLLLLSLLSPALAQTGSIRAIVPNTAGSGTDVVARKFSSLLEKELSTNIVIENKTGAGTAIGSAFVAKSIPDGRTMLFGTSAMLVTAATTQNLLYDFKKELIPVISISNAPLVLVFNSKYKDEQDFLNNVSNKTVLYASLGLGSSSHLAALIYAKDKFEAQAIFYRGSPESGVDVAADRIDFTFIPEAVALGLVEAGKIKSSPSSQIDNWVGLFLPAGTPQHIIDPLKAASIKVRNLAEFSDFLKTINSKVMEKDDFSKYLHDRLIYYEKISKGLND